jgi:hypothetical protein
LSEPKPATGELTESGHPNGCDCDGYTSTGKWTVEWLEAQDLPSLPRRETLVAICKLANAALAAKSLESSKELLMERDELKQQLAAACQDWRKP